MTDDLQQQKRLGALNIPHGLLVVDTVLKAKSDHQQVQITLGWEAPNETFNPTATLVMTADFALELAAALNKAVQDKASLAKPKRGIRAKA